MRYVEIEGMGMQGDLSVSSGTAKMVILDITIDKILEITLQNPDIRVSSGEFVVVEFPASKITYVSEEFPSDDYKIFLK